MKANFYEVLGVEPSATSDEIKRAYFRQVREHSNEKEPEQFKVIRAAYETLSDVTARRDYDTMQQYGGAIQDLTDAADSCMEREDWAGAIRHFKEILVLDPHSNAARNSLGLCLLNQGNDAAAVGTFEQLVKESPDSVAYWMNLGFARFGVAESMDENGASRKRTLADARAAFERAVELQPVNSEAHQAVAMVLRALDDWSGAAKWLESAVSADGETDLHDIDALCQLCVVYVVQNELQRLKTTMNRLVDIAPDDREAKEYVASRLAVLGAQMLKACRFEESSLAFERACILDPSEKDLRKAYDYALNMFAASRDCTRLKNDSQVVGPLKFLAIIPLAEAEGEEIPQYKFDEALEALGTYYKSDVSDSLKRLRSSYAELYELSQKLFDELSRAVGLSPIASASQKRKTARQAEERRRKEAARKAAEAERERRRRDYQAKLDAVDADLAAQTKKVSAPIEKRHKPLISAAEEAIKSFDVKTKQLLSRELAKIRNSAADKISSERERLRISAMEARSDGSPGASDDSVAVRLIVQAVRETTAALAVIASDGERALNERRSSLEAERAAERQRLVRDLEAAKKRLASDVAAACKPLKEVAKKSKAELKAQYEAAADA